MKLPAIQYSFEGKEKSELDAFEIRNIKLFAVRLPQKDQMNQW